MSELDLNHLRKVAEEATEGPWTWNATPVDTVSGEGGDNCIDAGTIGVTGYVYADEDAEHIAAFDPPTAIALLNRLQAAEAKLARVIGVHTPTNALMNPGRNERVVEVCTGCGTDDGNWQIYPCPTIRALDGAS